MAGQPKLLFADRAGGALPEIELPLFARVALEVAFAVLPPSRSSFS